jgi:hypothetical protein
MARYCEGKCVCLENQSHNDNCDEWVLSGAKSVKDDRADISGPAVGIVWNGNASDTNHSIVENQRPSLRVQEMESLLNIWP